MKKCRNLFNNLLWIAVLCCGAMVAACSDDKDDPKPEPEPEPTTPVITLTQGAQIAFTNDIREITVDSIMTNVAAISVKSNPDWAKVELSKVSDGYYKAVVSMQAGDLDSDKRDGEIVFSDGTEEGAQAKLKVTCLAAGEIVLDKAAFAEAFPGTAGTANFTVYGLEDYEYTCYKKTIDRELGVVYTKIEGDTWFTVAAAAAGQTAALTAKVYEVKWEEYNVADGKDERAVSIFIVPADELADFDPLDSNEDVQVVELTQTNAYIPPVKINLDSTSYVQSGVEGLEFTVTLSEDYDDVELYAWLMLIEPENVEEPLFSMGDPESGNRAQWVTITEISHEKHVFTFRLSCPAMTAADVSRGNKYRSCTLYALPKTSDGKFATEEVTLTDWMGEYTTDHVIYDDISLYQYLDNQD